MTQIKIFTDNYGRLTSDSRAKINNLIGERLAAVALPHIEREIKARVVALRQGDCERIGNGNRQRPTRKAAPRLMSSAEYFQNMSGANFQRRFYEPSSKTSAT
jgi:hypothetical protein